MKKLLLFTALLSGVFLGAGSIDYWTPPAKKLIECGWSQRMNGTYLKAHIQHLEASSPCQGVRVHLRGRDENGRKFIVDGMFGTRTEKPRKWKYEYFKEDIDALKQTRFVKFTDNFFFVNTNYGNVDWFSDADWDVVCHNFGMLARISKEVGFKGFIFDPEWYRRKSKPFFYELPVGKTSDDMEKIIRQRGREWGNAVFKNYPDIKLLVFMSLAGIEGHRMVPEAGSLRAAFFNGVYDVIPPGATIIEGHENHGYGAATAADFANLRVDMGENFMRMLDKKNIAKYKLQTQLAAALYLDPYLAPITRETTFIKHLRPEFKKSSRLTVLRRNLHRAFSISDEYVWIWSEGGRWYNRRPVHPGSKLVWEKIHPGVTRTVESACDPLSYAKKVMQEQNLPNLVRDPEITGALVKPYRSENYSFWSRYYEGNFSLLPKGGKGGKNAFQVSGAPKVFTIEQGHAVKPNQLYYIRARMKIVSGNSARYALLVAFRDNLERNGWLRTTQMARFGEADSEGWRIAEIAVIVPEDMSTMMIRFFGNRQQKDDVVLFDNLEIFKIDDGYFKK